MLARLLLLPLLFASADVRADDVGTDADRLARRTLAAIDLVARHYVAAPPTQEIVRQSVAALRREAGMDPPVELGRELTTLTQTDEFLEVLTREWQQLLPALAEQGNEVSGEDLLARALSALLRAMPGHNQLIHTRAHLVEEQFAANRYVGTGIALGGARDGIPPTMTRVFPDGPADRVGAKDGDRILEIKGQSTEGLTLADVVELLRGPADSEVEVVLQQNDDEPRRYTITRGVVPIQHTHPERRYEASLSIDVIRFDRLTSATVSDLRKMESDWETRPDALLIDLQLGGTDLHQATLLADALLDGGTIGHVTKASGTRTIESSREALFADIPMFVLVGPATSGTIEWLAAALQDQQRATLLGRRSAGQPFTSDAFELPDSEWVITLTTGILHRGDGRRLLRLSASERPPVVTARLHRNPRAAEVQSPANEHDGGVIPDRPIATTPRAPVQTGGGEIRFDNQSIPTELAVRMIPRLLRPADDDSEGQ